MLILAPEAYLPLREVGARFHASMEGVAAAEQVFAVLERPGRVAADRGAAAPVPSGPGPVVFAARVITMKLVWLCGS